MLRISKHRSGIWEYWKNDFLPGLKIFEMELIFRFFGRETCGCQNMLKPGHVAGLSRTDVHSLTIVQEVLKSGFHSCRLTTKLFKTSWLVNHVQSSNQSSINWLNYFGKIAISERNSVSKTLAEAYI